MDLLFTLCLPRAGTAHSCLTAGVYPWATRTDGVLPGARPECIYATAREGGASCGRRSAGSPLQSCRAVRDLVRAVLVRCWAIRPRPTSSTAVSSSRRAAPEQGGLRRKATAPHVCPGRPRGGVRRCVRASSLSFLLARSLACLSLADHHRLAPRSAVPWTRLAMVVGDGGGAGAGFPADLRLAPSPSYHWLASDSDPRARRHGDTTPAGAPPIRFRRRARRPAVTLVLSSPALHFFIPFARCKLGQVGRALKLTPPSSP